MKAANMGNNEPVIGPTTKISDLLSTWPELEKVLMDLSPAFRKLQNPILRKTIGKVATLQQIAVVGHVPVHVIINALRKEVGQQETGLAMSFEDHVAGAGSPADQMEGNGKKPEWVDAQRVSARFNAVPVINAGESPMGSVFKALDDLKAGEVLLLITPFVPAPILDKLKERNCLSFTVKIHEELFENYILKPG